MTTVLSDDAGPLTIQLSGGSTARVFGAPFLLLGGYLGYHLIAGVIDLIAGRAALSEMAAGTVILLIVTAGFLVPGWLLMFSRARVEIDRTARTITYVRDLRLHQLRERRHLSEFQRIEVDLLSVSSTRRSSARRRVYGVELAAKGGGHLTIGLFDDLEEAIAFGRRMGSLVGLPVADLSGTEQPGQQ